MISHSGGFLQNIISFITDNKDLIGANANFASSAYSAGKNIHDAAKNPEEDYKKSDKEIIEDMKVERVYKDLQDLKKLRKLKVERVYKELSKIKKGKDLKLYKKYRFFLLKIKILFDVNIYNLNGRHT